MKNLKLSARGALQDSCIQVGDVLIGKDFVVMAGPCSVESEPQTLEIAHAVKSAGANILRGGAFKPRTSPYSFQGLGEAGLIILAKASKETGLPVVSEVMDPRDVPLVAEHVDMLQIGSRNMQNFPLLKEVGRQSRPVLLKRGMNATLEEWLNAAEYILSEGNPNVVLCERGIRTFETYTRNTLDLSAVPALKELTHLPVIVDPSHAAGLASLIPALSFAALGSGASGLMIEVHSNPSQALSDREQALSLQGFSHLMERLSAYKEALLECQEDNSVRQLERLRGQIDSIDSELIELLVCRMKICKRARRLKNKVRDPEREQELLKNVLRQSQSELSQSFVTRIFNLILEESRRIQRLSRPKISLGFEG